MIWSKRKLVVGAVVAGIVVVLFLFFTGRLQPGLIDAEDVELVVVGEVGRTYALSREEDKAEIDRIVAALNRARGKNWKLDSPTFLLFHTKDGQCIVYGIALLDRRHHGRRAVLIGDSENNNYYSKALFRPLKDILKNRDYLYKESSLPDYRVETLRMHYPQGGITALEKTDAAFPVLAARLRMMTACVNTFNCRITRPEEIAVFYRGEASIERVLQENGGVEIRLSGPIDVSCFEIVEDWDYVMNWHARHEAFSSNKIFVFKDPRLRDCPLIALNSIREPQRYFVFMPSDTKAGKEGYCERLWEEILDVLRASDIGSL